MKIKSHLISSPFLGLVHAPIVETRFFELAMSFLDFSHPIALRSLDLKLEREDIQYM